jgi:hypothetical protein
MTVVAAIKQSIETSAGPGVSVNTHPNPFFINVNGAIDLKNAATLIIERLDAYDAALKAKIEKSIKEATARAAANDSTITEESTNGSV